MKCERCTATTSGHTLFDYCETCSQNLCNSCMADGCCQVKPARSGMGSDYGGDADLPAEDWLESLYAETSVHTAIDMLFDRVDRMMLDEKFEDVDGLLRIIDVDRLDSNLMVGVLTITQCARERLAERVGALERIEKRLRATDPDRVDELLQGLR